VEDGALWFNSVLGRTFIYYEDADSAQWVEIGAGSGPTAAAVFTSAPASAELGQLWFDSETGNLYFYYVDADSAQWIQVRSAAPAAGDLDDLDDVTITTPADGDTLVYDNGDWVNFPSGKILQVVSTTLTTDFSASLATGSYTNVTGLAATITPTSSSSKILIRFSAPNSSSQSDRNAVSFRLLRDSTEIGSSTSSSGSQTRGITGNFIFSSSSALITSVSAEFLDSPATTSAITYNVNVGNASSGTNTIYVNRTERTDNDIFSYKFSSTITVMEVAG
jgi:hypothetical protein